jgi:hypothetical protein
MKKSQVAHARNQVIKSHTRLFTYLVTYLLSFLLTAWCRMLFEKLIATQLIKKHPAFFMDPQGSLPRSQKPATIPYPEPAEFSSPRRCLSS